MNEQATKIYALLRQLYLNGANREDNEPGYHKKVMNMRVSKPDDDGMVRDILYCATQLSEITDAVAADLTKKEETENI